MLEAERNKLRSEGAAAGRTIAKLSAQLAAAPKARAAGCHVMQHGAHHRPVQTAAEGLQADIRLIDLDYVFEASLQSMHGFQAALSSEAANMNAPLTAKRALAGPDNAALRWLNI